MRITEYKIKKRRDKLDLELVKERSFNYTTEENLNNAWKVAIMLNNAFDLRSEPEEHVYMIALNMKCKPIGLFEVSHGSFNASMIDNKSVLARALLCGASAIIVAHNHPSGTLEPSEADIKSTKDLIKAAEIIGMPLLDHVIIANNSYTSLREQGYFNV